MSSKNGKVKKFREKRDWREDREYRKKLKHKILDVTPTLDKRLGNLYTSTSRGKEILRWIEDNKYEGKYLVLDDECYDIKNIIPDNSIIEVEEGWFKGGLKYHHVEYLLKGDLGHA